MDDGVKAWIAFLVAVVLIIGSIVGFDNWWRVEAGRTALEMVKTGMSPEEANRAAWGRLPHTTWR